MRFVLQPYGFSALLGPCLEPLPDIDRAAQPSPTALALCNIAMCRADRLSAHLPWCLMNAGPCQQVDDCRQQPLIQQLRAEQ
jgi:hypothetical protein